MSQDAIDVIRETLAALYPELDTSGLAVTGRILRLATHLEEARNQQLRELNLSSADFDVLATVRRRATGEGVNPKDVQKSVMISSGGLSKRLDRLESGGLIERHRDPQDRRGVLIKLSSQGRRLIDRALPAVLGSERSLLEGALGSARDRQRLTALLHALLLHTERELDEPTAGE